MLVVTEQARSEALRVRMDASGCVFQFVVLALEGDATVDETLHRQALWAMHEQLMAELHAWHRQLVANPAYVNQPAPSIDWHPERALARRLADDEVAGLRRTEQPFYRAFRKPPYDTRFLGGEAEAQALFHEWLDLLGLVDGEQPEVIDWTSNLSADGTSEALDAASSEPWSDYFDAGLEWWGVWCLTIWNPQRRTLSVVGASTTD
ncbi:hypothetical protein BZL41_03825 [Pseudomonas sp. PIC25]|uniref:hypothetical protein n=1 Tax=Pseudomonas sp. PIC25 TaxID=1958773 RepID=UPI000BAB6A62|nr:hypothetical protein [Pseudomonas sp. PIC25]PAU66067.1 hypothetical protein BZL41_03825 [Pseudomonas sp. PIC25]